MLGLSVLVSAPLSSGWHLQLRDHIICDHANQDASGAGCSRERKAIALKQKSRQPAESRFAMRFRHASSGYTRIIA
jgi:hypothetical protein